MQYIAIFEVAICNITNGHIVSALVITDYFYVIYVVTACTYLTAYLPTQMYRQQDIELSLHDDKTVPDEFFSHSIPVQICTNTHFVSCMRAGEVRAVNWGDLACLASWMCLDTSGILQRKSPLYALTIDVCSCSCRSTTHDIVSYYFNVKCIILYRIAFMWTFTYVLVCTILYMHKQSNVWWCSVADLEIRIPRLTWYDHPVHVCMYMHVRM